MTTLPNVLPPAVGHVEPLKSGPTSLNLAVNEQAKGLPATEALPQNVAAQAMAAKRLAYVKGLLSPYRLSSYY